MAEIPPQTIAIIGAGIAGPVLALTILSRTTLRKLYRPIIYERFPHPASSSQAHIPSVSGAAVALTSNALFPLYSLGLKEKVDAISCETERIKIWRAYGGKEGSHKYFNEIVHPNWQEDLGTFLRVVKRGALQALLLKRIEELGGEVVWGEKLKEIQKLKGGVRLIFDGKTQVDAGLVVGADGGWSGVRRWICEQNEKEDGNWKPWFSGADGVYGVSTALEPSVDGDGGEVKAGDTHWVLLDSGTASSWALPGGRQFWTVSFPSKSPPDRQSNSPEAQKQKLSGLFEAEITLGEHSLEETEDILKKYEDSWHPVAGNFRELFKRRACFVIEDATILADALSNCPPSDSEDGIAVFSNAIKEYTRSRAPRSKSMTNQSYYTALLGMSDRWWWRWLRDFATAWIPMGGDLKANTGKKPKDQMGWLYEERFEVESREDHTS